MKCGARNLMIRGTARTRVGLLALERRKDRIPAVPNMAYGRLGRSERNTEGSTSKAMRMQPG